MEKMRMRFTNAVASQLSAAPHSTAKTELIEELSDNLYHRYLDMTAAGMDESQAFEAALDDLGDVDELLDYLKGLSPEEELPKLTLHPYEEQEKVHSDLNEIIDNVDGIVKQSLDRAGDALKQAREALRKAGQTGWQDDSAEFDFHMDEGPDDPDVPFEPESCGKADRKQDQKWEFSAELDTDKGKFSAGAGPKNTDVFYGIGYDKAKGGFFTRWGEWKDGRSDGQAISSRGLRGVDIQTVNGDVTIHLLEDADAAIQLDGDVDELEVKITDNGVLAIRQGRTASSSFFFLRGLSSADVELFLPRRRWEFIQVSAVNGDVTVDGGFELERLSVKTTSGDLECECAACGKLYFKSTSGDLRCMGLTGDAQAETMSGDVQVSGHIRQAALSSMSGEVELDGSAEQIHMTSMSGGIRLETSILPEVMELSSKSGDCEARIPDTEPFTLRYKTISGELYSDFPLVRTSSGATYGGGGRRVYTMTSISGDVELKKF